MIHEYSSRWVDAIAFLLAGVSVASFLSQLAVVVTILAGLGSLSLVALRWFDRWKYGRED